MVALVLFFSFFFGSFRFASSDENFHGKERTLFSPGPRHRCERKRDSQILLSRKDRPKYPRISPRLRDEREMDAPVLLFRGRRDAWILPNFTRVRP